MYKRQGHGLVEVAKHCQKMGIEAFAVATIDEGIKLREHGIYGEILVLGYSHPIRAIELHNYRLIQTIVNREHARQLNESGHMINVHIKIDPSFCTACYREGRTGDRFMALCKNMQILNCCHPNALMTLKEYLEEMCIRDRSIPDRVLQSMRSQPEKKVQSPFTEIGRAHV